MVSVSISALSQCTVHRDTRTLQLLLLLRLNPKHKKNQFPQKGKDHNQKEARKKSAIRQGGEMDCGGEADNET